MKKIIGLALVAFLISGCHRQAPETDLEKGKALYAEHCSSCHGPKGDGQGEAAEYLFPKPRNLTSGILKYRTTRGEFPSDLEILQTMKKGIPGSSMPGWDILGMGDWRAILAYIKSLAPKLDGKPGSEFNVPSEPAVTKELIDQGSALFAQSGCIGCHGVEGQGNGPAAMSLKDRWGDRILPRDLTRGPLKWGTTPKEIYRSLALGIAGTPMPSYESKFTADQLWSLVHYLKSIQKPHPEGYDPSNPSRTFLRAARVAGPLPLEDSDPAWRGAPAIPVFLKPLWFEREATEWLSVKALTNGQELALLVEWEDDQLNASPGLEDKLAVQFPMEEAADPADLPYVGMGSAGKPVNIWEWNGKDFLDSNASGPRTLKAQKLPLNQLTGKARFAEGGGWHVIFRRRLQTLDRDDAKIGGVGYFSFALWDGDLPRHPGPDAFSEWLIYQLE
ncbi:MAG: c-type cytochrome [Deltaproteobacteria bacterium]|nr:c-type cytochrome [Deltaproteobacteria bacterium]